MKPTSEKGKTEMFAPAEPWFSLYDFDIDGAKLKENHHNLLRRFAPVLRTDGWIFLRGLTSRTGPFAHNRQLAARRINAVKESLIKLGIAGKQGVCGCATPKILIDPIGEGHDLKGGDEEEKHRAVWLRFHNSPQPPSKKPIPPKREKPDCLSKKLTSTHFQLCVDGGDIAGIKLKMWALMFSVYFKIRLVGSGCTAPFRTYHFTGMGTVISLKSILGLKFPFGVKKHAVPKKHNWIDFRTDIPVRIDQLGPAMKSASLMQKALFQKTPGSKLVSHPFSLQVSKRFSPRVRFEVNNIDLGLSIGRGYTVAAGSFDLV